MSCQKSLNKSKKEKMEKPPKEPDNLTDWLWYVKFYEKHIFVRSKNESTGKYENKSLDQLSSKEWADKISAFLDRGILPARLVADEEMQEHEEKSSTDTCDQTTPVC